MKNFLFDFDGTLADTLPLCISAFREAIEPLAGRKLSDADIIETFGPSEEGTIAALIPDHQEQGLRGYLNSYETLHHKWPAPFPGMVEILRFLREKGAFVGMVTGKGAKSAALSLERFGISDLFQAIETGSPRGPVKDEKIAHLLKTFNLDRAETLYIGDVVSDITASHACGIKATAAAWAATADLEALRAAQPDFLFTSIADFDAFIRGFFQ
ncbi:HAD hydrolase-like protein [Ruficoccus amylovorans]|uniref:phosphoglycolate phosphatase n=1 Tax=Ruficoccus amylovorans TaxID=1804625 RepID=A0A842HIT5_9BACT|nr:HAD hydrolase-like protein [Ruficoccus amylovorans]MBC2595504.1 HAD hydrolase-like protein [Ruficoccus amylovorans]